MSIIKIRRKIKSLTLRIRELEAFKGKTVDITIVADEERRVKTNEKLSLAGSLSGYSNAALIEKEKDAWELAVKDKHENN